MKVVGLFAGIGGLELGLSRAGHQTSLLCELESGAAEVLRSRFPDTPLVNDVRDLDGFPEGTDLVAAGFPCQDLSQAGKTKGIDGKNSGLITEVFRLLKAQRTPWVFLENVPFMLQLNKGAAIRHVVTGLEDLGYKWAYRVVDTRAFGIPQRRERVMLLASLDEEPQSFLFEDEVSPEFPTKYEGKACGFYWTEGVRGLGWAIDGVPTLKGGSTIGIPSPPAIWMSDGRIVTPDLRDSERLQGFESDWTLPAERVVRSRHRWKMVGNAVTVDVSEWVGNLLHRSPTPMRRIPMPLPDFGSWPKAAYGSASGRFSVTVSTWPCKKPYQPLEKFLQFEPKPLSERATAGFLKRLTSGSLRYPEAFRTALERHLASFKPLKSPKPTKPESADSQLVASYF